MTFITSSLLYIVVLGLVSAPVLFMARKHGRPHLMKRFAQAALVGGLFCGAVSAGQSRLVAQCENEGNTACFDAGADSMRLMVVIGFLVVSMFWSYLLSTD